MLLGLEIKMEMPDGIETFLDDLTKQLLCRSDTRTIALHVHVVNAVQRIRNKFSFREC